MSDQAQGPGWWQATDDKWYPPETHPSFVSPPAAASTPAVRPPTESPPSGPRLPETPATVTASPVTPSPAPDTGTRPSRQTKITGVLAVAIVVLALLLVKTNGDLGSARSDRDDAQAELDAIAAEAASRPDLQALAREYNLSSYVENSSSTSLSLTFRSAIPLGLRLLLDKTGFNATATLARIGNTRALDGTLTASGEHVDASWTYHPDNGLSIVFEVTD
jgi:hypothetical protein